MADQNESLKDSLIRILRESGKCLTATELAALRHDELGGSASINEILIDAELANATSQVYKSGKKYCLKPKREDVHEAAARIVRETKEKD